MSNQCAKGKRVERDVAHWLADNGYPSARRSQQHNGAEGLADVVANEPLIKDWHIECKGTKASTIKKCLLRDWYDQVTRDCPCDTLHPVVINEACRKPFTALIPLWAWVKLITPTMEHHYILGDTVAIHENLGFWYAKERLQAAVESRLPKMFHVGFYRVEMDTDHIFAVVLGTTWLELVKMQKSKI